MKKKEKETKEKRRKEIKVAIFWLLFIEEEKNKKVGKYIENTQKYNSSSQFNLKSITTNGCRFECGDDPSNRSAEKEVIAPRVFVPCYT